LVLFRATDDISHAAEPIIPQDLREKPRRPVNSNFRRAEEHRSNFQTVNNRVLMGSTARPIWYTFRVDASFDRHGITGVGLVLRATQKSGRDGGVIASYGEAYADLPTHAGEELAILRALEIAAEQGYRFVRIRSDCNQNRTALKESYEADVGSDRRGLQGRILRVARQFDQVKFAWIPRRKNQEAHHLARKAVQDCRPIVREDLSELLKPSVKD
jgi:ribonuclease HI